MIFLQPFKYSFLDASRRRKLNKCQHWFSFLLQNLQRCCTRWSNICNWRWTLFLWWIKFRTEWISVASKDISASLALGKTFIFINSLSREWYQNCFRVIRVATRVLLLIFLHPCPLSTCRKFDKDKDKDKDKEHIFIF